MFKPGLVVATIALSLVSAVSQAAPIVLNTGLGGSATETFSGLALGNSLSFEYQYSNVVFVDGPWIGFNTSLVNPCCGPQFNDYRASDSGWLSGNIDTSGAASPNDLAFTANTFGAPNNSATITIRNVTIDQRVVAGGTDGDPTSVPEPATLGLLGLGLALMGVARRRKSLS